MLIYKYKILVVHSIHTKIWALVTDSNIAPSRPDMSHPLYSCRRCYVSKMILTNDRNLRCFHDDHGNVCACAPPTNLNSAARALFGGDLGACVVAPSGRAADGALPARVVGSWEKKKTGIRELGSYRQFPCVNSNIPPINILTFNISWSVNEYN